MPHKITSTSRNLTPVRTATRTSIRTPEPTPTYAAPDPAAYRRWLSWLFTGASLSTRPDEGQVAA